MNQPVLDGRSARRKDPKVYRQTFEDAIGEEYELVTEYERASQPIRVRHRPCGHEFEAFPATFIQRPNCRHCKKKAHHLNPKVFEARFQRNQTEEYVLLDEYTRGRIPVTVQHVTCGEVFKVMPAQTVYPLKCPTCRLEKGRLTEDIFLERLTLETYQTYDVYYEVFKEEQAVKIKHQTCGNTFEEYPGVFLRKPCCPHCEKTPTQSESFEQNIEERYAGRFKVLSQFRGYQHPVCVQHMNPDCLRYSYPYATNLSAGHYRCPYCEARGQREIKPF